MFLKKFHELSKLYSISIFKKTNKRKTQVATTCLKVCSNRHIMGILKCDSIKAYQNVPQNTAKRSKSEIMKVLLIEQY